MAPATDPRLTALGSPIPHPMYPIRPASLFPLPASLAIAFLLLPSTAIAQDRARGSGGGGRPAERSADITKRDLERQDPVRIALDKRKDLKLDDAQRARLEAMRDDSLGTMAAELLDRVDSLQKANRPRSNAPIAGSGGGFGGRGRTSSASGRGGGTFEREPTPEELRRLREGRALLNGTVSDLQALYTRRTIVILESLTPEQAEKARELFAKAGQ